MGEGSVFCLQPDPRGRAEDGLEAKVADKMSQVAEGCLAAPVNRQQQALSQLNPGLLVCVSK